MRTGVKAVVIFSTIVSIFGLHGAAKHITTGVCGVATADAAIKATAVYKTRLSKAQLDELESYIVGVVAAEMPISYNIEALKAQAVAARTYALRALEGGCAYGDIAQAHITEAQMRQRWGSRFDEYYARARQAVTATEGEIITYADKPILAAFCACSCGNTEDSSEVWNEQLPYLKSVASQQDKADKDFTATAVFDRDNIVSLFGGVPEVQSRTQAGYVKCVCAGGRQYSGADIRARLGLRSACFTVSQSGGKVYFTTSGYGHGVGMSQVGAGKMAADGASFENIILHYYLSTDIEKAVPDN